MYYILLVCYEDRLIIPTATTNQQHIFVTEQSSQAEKQTYYHLSRSRFILQGLGFVRTLFNVIALSRFVNTRKAKDHEVQGKTLIYKVVRRHISHLIVLSHWVSPLQNYKFLYSGWSVTVIRLHTNRLRIWRVTVKIFNTQWRIADRVWSLTFWDYRMMANNSSFTVKDRLQSWE
jgi:hypothetical protein